METLYDKAKKHVLHKVGLVMYEDEPDTVHLYCQQCDRHILEVENEYQPGSYEMLLCMNDGRWYTETVQATDFADATNQVMRHHVAISDVPLCHIGVYHFGESEDDESELPVSEM